MASTGRGVGCTYSSLRKAEFEYVATTEDELSVHEGQLVWIIEDDDPEWHKVKIKSADSMAAPQIGLVPASYLTSAPVLRLVRAMYDYSPALNEEGVPDNDEELAITEGEELSLVEEEEDWCLVLRGDGQGAGFVPTSYIEDADAVHHEAGPVDQPADVSEEEEEEYIPVAASAAAASTYTGSLLPPPQRNPSTVSATNVKTWAVTEIDKKKKKKKGTLGVGNGALFFASESDKVGLNSGFCSTTTCRMLTSHRHLTQTPVQQYPLSSLQDITTEKFKHLHLSFPSSPEPLHFVIGSKDIFEEIVDKIEADRASSGSTAAKAASPAVPAAPRPPPVAAAAAAPIAPPPPAATSGYMPPPPPIGSASSSNIIPSAPSTPARNGGSSTPVGSEANAVALYDFEPQGDDEIAIVEGERVILIDDGSTSDDPDWAKIRKVGSNVEGVVPASYIELDPGASAVGTAAKRSIPAPPSVPAPVPGHAAAPRARSRPTAYDEEEEERREEEERAAAAIISNQLLDEKRAQMARDREAKAERASKREAEKERQRHARMESQPRAAPIPVPTSKSGLTQLGSDDDAEPSRRSRSSREAGGKSSRDKAVRKPDASKIRIWKDRTGQFKVEAEFIGLKDNKIRLHKLNGVIIEVPLEKMSSEDTAWLKKEMGGGDEQRRDRSSREASSSRHSSSKSTSQSQSKKQNTTDWFEFFLNAGCDIDACQRYARNADNEGIEDSLIPDLEESNLRSLGLKEGDIIRVRRYLKEKYAGPPPPTKSDREEQIAADARMSLALQNGRPTPPAPGLFSGPDGKLRRGRRNTANNRTAAGAVDPNALVAAGSEIAKTRGSTPVASTISAQSTGATSLDPTKRSSSTQPQVGGFDDDAWEVKPSPSPAPPAPAPVAASAPPPAPAAPASAPAPAATAPAPAPAPAVSSPATETPPVQAPARTGSAAGLTYNDGLLAQLGIGNNVQRPSSTPTASTAQMNTLAVPAYNPNAPRGPITPIAANQGLLAPLVPTRTGFNPTPLMPMATGFNAMQPQFTGIPSPVMVMSQPTGFVGMNAAAPMQMQPTGMNFQTTPQPTGFMQPQPTGFMQPQPTGYMQQPQPTGFMLPQPTGYNPQASVFGQQQPAPFQQPPQQPQQPQQQQPIQFNPMPPSSNGSAPAQNANKSAQFEPTNIFASMKDGTFASGSTQLGPQQANKYDSLRPQPTGFAGGAIQAQPTGFGIMQPQMTGYNPSFNGQQQQQGGYGGFR
ncbi:BQ2448_5409 [Microbotryum intermedium]|uniref:Actin cytoskeleton-regulatory complex protein SLA1 n=1 Tax=Microbotryum intermedium TaxID=269621 RepID=A0A238F9E0_9BASI|nr:BQ2448_5409 [Microbotryum intermedium]